MKAYFVSIYILLTVYVIGFIIKIFVMKVFIYTSGTFVKIHVICKVEA